MRTVFGNNGVLNYALPPQHLKSLLNTLIAISILGLGIIVVLSYINKDIVLAGICQVLAIKLIISYYLSTKNVAVGIHVFMLSYIAIFFYASSVNLTLKYPFTLFYILVMGYVLLFFKSPKIKLFYLILCSTASFYSFYLASQYMPSSPSLIDYLVGFVIWGMVAIFLTILIKMFALLIVLY